MAPKSEQGLNVPRSETIISVEDVVREAEKIAKEGPSKERIAELSGTPPMLPSTI